MDAHLCGRHCSVGAAFITTGATCRHIHNRKYKYPLAKLKFNRHDTCTMSTQFFVVSQTYMHFLIVSFQSLPLVSASNLLTTVSRIVSNAEPLLLPDAAQSTGGAAASGSKSKRKQPHALHLAAWIHVIAFLLIIVPFGLIDIVPGTGHVSFYCTKTKSIQVYVIICIFFHKYAIHRQDRGQSFGNTPAKLCNAIFIYK